MRIGIMLRTLDEKGGIAVYSENVVSELLRLDRHNNYVLFYQNEAHVGRFAQHANVTECVVPGRNRVIWDQVSIPYACWQEKVDVIFHPKFTAPLLAPARTVMVVHGADWFLPEQAQYYAPLDVWLTRRSMPLYFRKCQVVISVSQLTTANFHSVLDLPAEKIKTIYFGPARHFRPVRDVETLGRVRARYGLPERFIFTLTKPLGDGRKNLGRILKAYAGYHQQSEERIGLVVGGQDAHRFRQTYNVPDTGYGADISFPGWIEQADMPAVFSLADLFLYPSNLEAFPIPVTEAMACGTPVITSDANGLKEIAGDAAMLVDPADTCAITDAIVRLLSSASLRQAFSGKGLARAQRFSWDRCARETLAVLETVGNQ
jgi:glycosyltransferase involved in cell wall biosynthesis